MDASQPRSDRPPPPEAPVAPGDLPVGGQAVLERVMMRGVSARAVAVRVDDDISVQSFPLVSALRRHRWLRWPLIRGVIALGESLKIGLDALNIWSRSSSGSRSSCCASGWSRA